MQKLHFASSRYSALILKHCDAFVDDFVFDQNLQKKVYQKIAPLLSNQNGNRFDRKRENAPLFEEAAEIPIETLRNFYSKIKSLETLKLIVETVFAISMKHTEKQSNALINYFVKHAVYERIWNTYKHTDKELKDKEASQCHRANAMCPSAHHWGGGQPQCQR